MPEGAVVVITYGFSVYKNQRHTYNQMIDPIAGQVSGGGDLNRLQFNIVALPTTLEDFVDSLCNGDPQITPHECAQAQIWRENLSRHALRIPLTHVVDNAEAALHAIDMERIHHEGLRSLAAENHAVESSILQARNQQAEDRRLQPEIAYTDSQRNAISAEVL